MTNQRSTGYTISLFDHVIQELLSPTTAEKRIKSNALFAYVQRLIKQFNLFDVDVEDVITESYLRAIKYIEKTGKEIHVPEAFIKRTSLNVVREMSRKRNRFQTTDYDSVQYQITADEELSNLACEEFSDTQIESLKLSLHKLKPQDRKMLILWKIDRLAWKQIVEELSADGQKLTVSAARKRGQRILEKLRREVN